MGNWLSETGGRSSQADGPKPWHYVAVSVGWFAVFALWLATFRDSGGSVMHWVMGTGWLAFGVANLLIAAFRRRRIVQRRRLQEHRTDPRRDGNGAGRGW